MYCSQLRINFALTNVPPTHYTNYSKNIMQNKLLLNLKNTIVILIYQKYIECVDFFIALSNISV